MAEIKASDLREYGYLFDRSIVNASKYPEVDGIVNKIVAHKDQYVAVSNETGVPWFFIGIVHYMEAGLDFNCHIHNGDPLSARTVQVPAGRPKTEQPPFAWKDSAIDSMQYEGFAGKHDWDLNTILFRLESYNGMGYHKKGINSPYLWSYTNQYTKGKFVKDGVFDPEAVSKQCGAATLLRRLMELHIISVADVTEAVDKKLEAIKAAGAKVVYNTTNTPTPEAAALQSLLNDYGHPLKADGLAGKNTSTTYQIVTGSYLKGDPRA